MGVRYFVGSGTEGRRGDACNPNVLCVEGGEDTGRLEEINPFFVAEVVGQRDYGETRRNQIVFWYRIGVRRDATPFFIQSRNRVDGRREKRRKQSAVLDAKEV